MNHSDILEYCELILERERILHKEGLSDYDLYKIEYKISDTLEYASEDAKELMRLFDLYWSVVNKTLEVWDDE